MIHPDPAYLDIEDLVSVDGARRAVPRRGEGVGLSRGCAAPLGRGDEDHAVGGGLRRQRRGHEAREQRLVCCPSLLPHCRLQPAGPGGAGGPSSPTGPGGCAVRGVVWPGQPTLLCGCSPAALVGRPGIHVLPAPPRLPRRPAGLHGLPPAIDSRRRARRRHPAGARPEPRGQEGRRPTCPRRPAGAGPEPGQEGRRPTCPRIRDFRSKNSYSRSEYYIEHLDLFNFIPPTRYDTV